MMEIHPFGPETTLHHVGLVVPSIQAICADCRVFHDPIQKVDVAFISLHGLRLELIEASCEDSPVTQSLRKGVKLVHICYEVADLEQALSLGAEEGYRCIAKPVPAVAFERRRIAWAFHRAYGLIELVERQHPGSD